MRRLARAIGIVAVLFAYLDVVNRGPICAVLDTLFEEAENWLEVRLLRLVERRSGSPAEG